MKPDPKARQIVAFLLIRARQAYKELMDAQGGSEIGLLLASENYACAHNAAEFSRRILYGREL